ncbi:hypothetical protein [Actinomadura sp. B10D3]|uniref:hypothetical protein n=1 Tax=Actinomadura sp. B10D3 TaxID=3153557 RepID=UPI00325CAE33
MIERNGVLPAAVTAITSSPSHQRPVVMITPGADGLPQVCVPDWGELRAVDDRRLRVAVWPTDPTAVSLDGGAPVLLIVTAMSEVFLVRATPRRLVNAAMVWAHYELTITSARIADRGTSPRLEPGSAEAGEEFLAAGPARTDDPLRRKVAAFRARRRSARGRSPWAAPKGSGGRGEHRCTEGARR